MIYLRVDLPPHHFRQKRVPCFPLSPVQGTATSGPMDPFDDHDVPVSPSVWEPDEEDLLLENLLHRDGAY